MTLLVSPCSHAFRYPRVSRTPSPSRWHQAMRRGIAQMRRVHSQFVGPVFRLVVVALLLGCMAPAAASAVPKALLSSFGAPNGVLGGQLFFPRGVAVNQSGAGGVPVGSVYVAEGNTNHRISQYTASGGFVRAWGFDVVSGNAETGFEVCAVAAQCKAGVSGVGAAHERRVSNQQSSDPSFKREGSPLPEIRDSSLRSE